MHCKKIQMGRKINFNQHVTSITKSANRNFRMKNRLDLLKLYVFAILNYARLSWVIFITSFQWRKMESIQSIYIRTIIGTLIIVNSSNFKMAYNTIRQQSKIVFYKNVFSTFNHIRFFSQATFLLTAWRETRPTHLIWTS